MLYSGRIFYLVMLVIFWVLTLSGIQIARRGKIPEFRKLAGLEALHEMVGRAAEMNKSIHFSTGDGGALTGTEAPQVVAGLAVLGYVASLAARYGVKLTYSVFVPEAIPIATDLMRQAYVKEGKADLFNAEEQIRFLSNTDMAFASAVQGIAERERPAASIMLGPFYGPAMLQAEAFKRVGSIQLAGTARGYHIPYLAIIADYTLIGEEIFAAGAYVSKDPTQMGSIRGQDLAKIVIIALTVLAVVAAAAGSRAISSLFKI